MAYETGNEGRHFGKDKVYMDIGLFGIGFNLKKHLGIKR